MRPSLPMCLLLVTGLGCSLDLTSLTERPEDGSATRRDASRLDAGLDAETSGDAETTVDGSTPDSGDDAGPPPPADFRDLTWGPPARVTLAGSEYRCGDDRDFDPVLTEDRGWLIVSRFELDCEVRRFHVFAWDGGSPTFVGEIGAMHPLDTEHNPHIIDGRHAGRPGDVLLLHTTGGGSFGDRDLWSAWLTGSPPLTAESPVPLAGLNTPLTDDGPTTTLDGRRIVFGRDDVLYEATGVPPTSWTGGSAITAVDTADWEGDPALSPDGRVLVFVRDTGGNTDLWVTRRADPDNDFGAPTALPSGGGGINTPDGEWDAFITVDGDLLYTRLTATAQEVWWARALFP